MTLSSNFIIRIQNLLLWLGAGTAFWWMRPTPETQIELLGRNVPPIPGDWLMVSYEGTLVQLYLCVFIGHAILYFWIGGWNQRGFSLIWTYIHTVFVFVTVNLGTDPVRIDWVNGFLHLFAEDGVTQQRINFLQDAVGMLFLCISASMTLVTIKWKVENLGADYFRYLWHSKYFLLGGSSGRSREERQAESAQLARKGTAAGVIAGSTDDAARNQSIPGPHTHDIGSNSGGSFDVGGGGGGDGGGAA